MPLTSSIEKTSAPKAGKTNTTGILQIVAGSVIFFVSGIVALVSKIWSVVTSLFFASASVASTSGSLPVIFRIGLVLGVVFVWLGVVNLRIAGAFRKISRIMGTDTDIKLSVLGQKLGWQPNKLVKTLRRQIAKGFWTDAYLDTDNGIFMLGYAPSMLKADSGDTVQEELFKSANGFMHELTTINLGISDQALKTQVTGLIDVAGQIYAFVKKSPEKARQIRQFSNYYLPMTVKLLKSYQELQAESIKSENIQESVQKIADSMTTIEDVFKKQLNDLYQDKALDISVEIEVLQNMTKEHDSH